MKAKTKNKLETMLKVAWRKKEKGKRVWVIKALTWYRLNKKSPVKIETDLPGVGGSPISVWVDAEDWKAHTDFYGL